MTVGAVEQALEHPLSQAPGCGSAPQPEAAGKAGRTLVFLFCSFSPERNATMWDSIVDFFMSGWTMLGMGVILAALVGVLLFLRNRRTDD
jgi:hypothetical protein